MMSVPRRFSVSMHKSVFLFRHGPPEEGGQHICRGCHIDARLSEEGERQTWENLSYLQERFGDRLKTALVVTSPMQRARRFGEVFCEPFGVMPYVASGLTDLDVGEWEGLSWEDIKKEWPKQFSLCWKNATRLHIPHGEPMLQFTNRVKKAWQHWIRQECELLIFNVHKCVNKVILSSIDDRLLHFSGQKIGCMNEVLMGGDGGLRIVAEDEQVYCT